MISVLTISVWERNYVNLDEIASCYKEAQTVSVGKEMLRTQQSWHLPRDDQALFARWLQLWLAVCTIRMKDRWKTPTSGPLCRGHTLGCLMLIQYVWKQKGEIWKLTSLSSHEASKKIKKKMESHPKALHTEHLWSSQQVDQHPEMCQAPWCHYVSTYRTDSTPAIYYRYMIHVNFQHVIICTTYVKTWFCICVKNDGLDYKEEGSLLWQDFTTKWESVG